MWPCPYSSSHIGGDVSQITVTNPSHSSFPHGKLCLPTEGQGTATPITIPWQQPTASLSLWTCSKEPAVPKDRNSSTPFITQGFTMPCQKVHWWGGEIPLTFSQGSSLSLDVYKNCKKRFLISRCGNVTLTSQFRIWSLQRLDCMGCILRKGCSATLCDCCLRPWAVLTFWRERGERRLPWSEI